MDHDEKMEASEMERYYTPMCFEPEPDRFYPLCIGNGSEECRTCCLYVWMESEGGA